MSRAATPAPNARGDGLLRELLDAGFHGVSRRSPARPVMRLEL